MSSIPEGKNVIVKVRRLTAGFAAAAHSADASFALSPVYSGVESPSSSATGLQTRSPRPTLSTSSRSVTLRRTLTAPSSPSGASPLSRVPPLLPLEADRSSFLSSLVLGSSWSASALTSAASPSVRPVTSADGSARATDRTTTSPAGSVVALLLSVPLVHVVSQRSLLTPLRSASPAAQPRDPRVRHRRRRGHHHRRLKRGGRKEGSPAILSVSFILERLEA